MKWKTISLLIVFLAVALIAALIITNRSRARGTLIYARGADATTLDPAEIEYGEDAKVAQNIYESLVTFDKDSTNLVPALAEKMPEMSPNGLIWTFSLKKGIRFHDGTPLTAEAVAFTFSRILDEKHPFRPTRGVPYGETYSFINKVEAKGPETVVFTLKQPNAVFLQTIALFTTEIVSPEAVKKYGPEFTTHPVGTGPYRLKEWLPKEKIVLERNPDYWGPKPSIAKVIFIPVLSPQTALEKLKNGEAHIVDHITLADVKTVEADPNLYVASQTSLNTAYLAFNLKKAPYNDPNFRKAVSLAIDRKAMNELVFYGQADIAKNIVPPAIWRDTGPIAEYDYDPAKAKEFLAKVNLKDIQIELWHMTFSRPYMPEPARLAEFIKDQLHKIGVEVKLQAFDKSAWQVKTKDLDHPLLLLGWSADYADSDNFLNALLHSEEKPSLNVSFFTNAEFDKAVSAAQSEPGEGKRKQLYRRAAEIYREELPTIPLAHVRQLAACSRKIEYHHHPIEIRLYPVTFK